LTDVVADPGGRYADIVFFADEAARGQSCGPLGIAERVACRGSFEAVEVKQAASGKKTLVFVEVGTPSAMLSR
jgi:hypothetical protein